MNQFDVHGFLQDAQFVFAVRNLLLEKSDKPLSDNHVSYLQSSLADLLEDCDRLGFAFISAEIQRFQTALKLRSSQHPMPQWEAIANIDALNHRIDDVLKQAVFMHVSLEKAKFHSSVSDEAMAWKKRVVDAAIVAAFPSSHKEMVRAFDCYATGNDTACVFHLMRAAEHGLRALVVGVGVVNPVVPLEYQQWQNLIEQVESYVRNARIDRWSQPAKGNAQAFFSSVVSDFYAFKDDIRNILMHTRTGGTYDEHQALHLIERVTNCLLRLAKHVGEDSQQQSILDPARFA